jgi:hypothetical protein
MASGQAASGKASSAPSDFQEHLARLEERGLLVRIDKPVCKDTQIHPLVRWQFVGNYPEQERREVERCRECNPSCRSRRAAQSARVLRGRGLE